MEKVLDKRVLWICLILVTLLIPGWLCETAFTGVKFDSDFVSSNPDGLYYYRIAEQAISQKSTEPLIYDSYGNFPYTHKIGFPPLFIRFFYWAKVLCNKISFDDSDFILGFVPVFFGWLTAVCIILTLWYCSYPRVFLVFLAFALIPLYPGIIVCEYGCFDHDFFVSFFLWVWILSAVLYYEKQRNLWLAIGGIGGFVVLGSWIGALLVFLMIIISCLVVWFSSSKVRGRYLKYCYVTTSIAVLLNSCMIAISPNDYGFDFLDFGMFHVLCVASASVFIFVLTKFEADLKNKLIFVTLAIVTVITTGVAMGESFFDLLYRFFATDPVFRNIAELKPMANISKLLLDTQSYKFALLGLSWTFFFLPIFILMPIDRLMKKESSIILQIWLSIMIIAGFTQIRYIRLPAIGCGIFVAIAVFFVWKSYFIIFNKNNKNYVNVSLGFILLLLLIRANSSLFYNGFDTKLRESYKTTLEWIAKNTKPTSGFSDNKKPEYGILAYWDIGHAINAYAKRPVIVNNCQWGMKNMAEVFSSTSEKEAKELCSGLGIKYILIMPSRVISKDGMDFWPAYKKLPEHDGYRALPSSVERSNDCNNWFYIWLKEGLGLHKNAGFDVASNFRIIYANYIDKSFPIADSALFERVEGAKVYLRGKPGSEASLSLKLSISGRLVKYSVEKIVPDDGVICFNIPYSCYFNNGVVSTDELYSISIVSHETNKRITGNFIAKEKDVIEGNQIATSSIRLFR